MIPVPCSSLALEMQENVTGTLWYLDRLSLYQTTKPYVANFPRSLLPLGTRTNQVPKAYHDIKIHDIRTCSKKYSLDHHGFMLSQDLKTSLEYDDFADSKKVSSIYCEEIMRELERMTGASFSRTLHHAVSASKVSHFPN